MIGKKLAVLVALCVITLPLFASNEQSSETTNTELKLIAHICYQASKIILGSYAAIGSVFNCMGMPFNHPHILLYNTDKRVIFMSIFAFSAVAYHGFTQLEKILDDIIAKEESDTAFPTSSHDFLTSASG